MTNNNNTNTDEVIDNKGIVIYPYGYGEINYICLYYLYKYGGQFGVGEILSINRDDLREYINKYIEKGLEENIFKAPKKIRILENKTVENILRECCKQGILIKYKRGGGRSRNNILTQYTKGPEFYKVIEYMETNL